MNCININQLFPSENGTNKNGKLDIESLFKGLPLNNVKKNNFNSSKLLDGINDRRVKKLKFYIKCLNNCTKQIEKMDNEGYTDTVFTIPDYVSEISAYNSNECLDYIIDNLTLQKIDVLKINNISLFITWTDIELKFNQ